ncbi:MFS transporter [Cellulomonas hominis]|uniref:MFS transporter n=1 Tax=Cellulomonas hominis TaxID=156981 RepID=A0A7Z8NRZ9_9CELL|nr:MFS transporter [Cellulomonas hominis]TKR27299.1 MFS transporter [Cellulomonas hominis]
MQVVSDLKQLWPLVDFRRLLTVRLVSQCSDGLFQAGLATLFFFSPENATTATGVAAAFAVLLLPFTVVGPWAGVLLDRWRRRQVLLVGNLVRAGLTLVVALVMATAGVGPAVYVLALATLSVNRFLLSALSASQPRVVAGPLLLTANSITPTLGTVSSGVGWGLGFLLSLALPDGGAQDVASLLTAAVLMTVAALLATRLGKDRLGPDVRADAAELRQALGTLARGLVDGARYLVRRGTPARALGVMAVHRFLYGAVFIASLLISRNLLSDPADPRAGLVTFGTVAAVTGVGFALAIVVTPVVSPLIGPHGWVTACLLLAAATQVLLVFTVAYPAVLAGSLVLGLAAQGAKIAVDTIVQRDTADAFRGRAFALYDVLFNAAFVGAAALAAVALPDTGWSPAVFALIAAGYLATALVYRTRATEPAEVPVPA